MLRTRPGLLALLCSLAHAAFALRDAQVFLHLGPAPSLPEAALLREVLAKLVLALAVGAGLLALRRSRGRDRMAMAALALAAPFVVDVFVAPLTRALGSGASDAGRWIFIGATEGVLVLLLFAAARGGRETHEACEARTAAPTSRAVGSSRALASASRAWPLRLAAVLVALAVALLLGEAAVRAAGLGARRYSNPMLLVPGDERRVPLSEVALFRPFGLSAEQVGLSARFRPYLFLKGWYDRPQWSYFDASGCVDYVFNRYGLRDHDFELDKAPGEFRVVAIGDSFTFGIGVQLDDCWTEVLERGLQQRRGGPVEVINAGFASGYQPVSYEEWIARDGVRLAPDVVAIGLCLNDVHPGISLYAHEPPSSVEQPLGGRSQLLNALQSTLRPAPSQPWTPPDYLALVRNEPQQWSDVQAALRRTHALLASKGIRLLVVPLPMVSGLQGAYPYTGVLKLVADFCSAEGIEHLDLTPRFLGQDERALWVHPTDQHPNDRGQKLIGEGVLDYLLLDSPAPR